MEKAIVNANWRNEFRLSREESDRHKHGDQHKRSGDDSAGDLLHGVGRGFKGLSLAFLQMTLNIFDHDDGVVDHQAVASVMPNSVSVLMEKPSSLTNANVPISDTGMVTAGMMVHRQSSRKMKMTRMTRKMAVPRVRQRREWIR